MNEEHKENPSMRHKKKKKHTKRTPGKLYKLSQACRKTAQGVASTRLFIAVYDNINLMFGVAEQILGCKSEQEKKCIQDVSWAQTGSR